MTHYLLRQSTKWNLLNEVYLLSKFDDSSFSVTENIQIFKLVILQTLSSPKLIFILLTLGKSKLILFILFLWLWTGHSYLMSLGNILGHRKQSKPTSFDKKIKRTNNKNWVPQSINSFTLLFLFVTCFSEFCDKI